jgi:uncharacterized protein YndB with AHSA1/START domain
MRNQRLQEDDMEHGTIEREIYVDAAPEILFDVVSSPDHITEWWPDEAHYEVMPGSTGDMAFGDPDAGGKVVQLTVVEVSPPRTFSFRWAHPADEVAAPGNSLLVTFELTPSGEGTLLRFTETGFREMGWQAETLEEQYNDHGRGWDHFLPRLAPYAATVAARR